MEIVTRICHRNGRLLHVSRSHTSVPDRAAATEDESDVPCVLLAGLSLRTRSGTDARLLHEDAAAVGPHGLASDEVAAAFSEVLTLLRDRSLDADCLLVLLAGGRALDLDFER